MVPLYFVNPKERPALWQKQKEAISFALSRGEQGACLFMRMGTGKTRVTIQIIKKLMVKEDAKLIYICAPLSVMHVWIEEWSLWGSFPLLFIDLHKTESAGLREAKKLSDAGWPVVCLVNYESAWQIGFKRERVKRGRQTVIDVTQVDTAMTDFKWDIGILDEATKIKTSGSQVGQFFRSKMRPITRFRYVLTGTAYTKRPLDVWGIVKFVTGDDVFPMSYEAFRSIYAIPHPYIKQANLGYQNLDFLAEKLSKCSILVEKGDMPDLPPAVHQKRYVELSPSVRKLYNQLKREAIAELERDEEEGIIITAFHIFTKTIKLRQIVSGFVIPDVIVPDGYDREKDGKLPRPDPVELGTDKLSVLLDILEERDEPTIIVVQYDWEEQYIAKAIEKKFGFRPKILNGSIQGADARHQLLKDASKDLCVIVKEVVACQGVDMRWADMTIFFSHSDRTDNYDQMLARNHRGGQTKSITYVHLITQGTIDEQIMARLENDLEAAKELEENWRKLL